MLLQADRQHNLPGRLELDKVPDPALLATRLRRLSDSPAQVRDNVAMPNLFEWSDSKKPGKKVRSNEDGALADGTGKEPKYLSKPSFFDRLFRRSAN
jgi:hypothetical protein